MKEIAVHAGYEVLMEVDENILLIVGDPQGISDRQLRPYPIQLLKIIIIGNNRTARNRSLCRITIVISCHRCLIMIGVVIINNIQI
jgi:hypothetical protein